MLTHWIWLTTRKGIGTRGCASLLRLFGTAERIYALTKEQCVRTDGFEPRWLESILDKDLTEAEKNLVNCDNRNISLLTYASPEYPERLRNIPDPPAVLYCRGNFPEVDEEAVIGIVGTRRCSAYGLLYAKQFSKQIANSGGIVVSGGARGIDTMALSSALDSHMPVICVLGCGVDIAYPRENRRLFEDITYHGCLLSEFPPGTPPERGNFPQRNRIISGLSLGVLVIEAPLKSGALITADHALEQGRDVYTIPGNMGTKQCEGSNALLRDGASFVMDGWELLESYVHLFPDKLHDYRSKATIEHNFTARYGMSVAVCSPDATNAASVELTDDEKTVLSQLSAEPMHADEVISLSGLPSSRVMSALTMLQIKALVEKQAGNYYVRK